MDLGRFRFRYLQPALAERGDRAVDFLSCHRVGSFATFARRSWRDWRTVTRPGLSRPRCSTSADFGI